MTLRLASKAREKAVLPKGYQFGDAGRPPFHPGAREFKVRLAFVDDRDPLPPWRAPHLNAAERLRRAEDPK